LNSTDKSNIPNTISTHARHRGPLLLKLPRDFAHDVCARADILPLLIGFSGLAFVDGAT
jgi:hypothetical protein